MSQNKTVYPGMGQEHPKGKSRSDAPKRTVFPGNNYSESASEASNARPLIGFLYSLSRTGLGEYWPVYLGRNTIGRSDECDIVLHEATVSNEHSELVVRLLKNPMCLDASISDTRSSNGTMLNGMSVRSSTPLECKNGDIITVGEVYQLYLVLIDAKALGLEVSDKFVNSEDSYEDEPEPPHFRTRGQTRDADDMGFNPRQAYYNDSHNDFTQGVDGKDGRPRKGSTVTED